MVINSIENEKVKYFKKLRTKKYIDSENLFIVEGYHLVEEAIKANLVNEIILLEQEVYSSNIKTTYVSSRVLKEISLLDSVPPIMAVVNKNNNEVLGDKIVILDGVSDPGNAGTIIRNCVAFGVDTIIFSLDSVSVYNDKVIRSSQGMMFKINIMTRDLTQAIKEIKSKEILLIGTSLHDAIPLSTLEKVEKYGIIFGNEGSGIKESVLKECDRKVKIEMKDMCESLNVGVSSGIILYHLR